ncbi:MAG: M50 family metallopeptidase [Pirellulales bacterium]|nr:M50 family metallopeptidase [Pirellulales bacterium]
MIFAEPGRTDYDLNFRLFGIPVRVHPMFWLVGLILGSSWPVQLLILWMIAWFLSILGHELGHALMMRGHQIRSSIVLYGFGGLTIPYSGDSPRYHHTGTIGRILIDFAGAGAGFFVVLLVVGLMYALGYGDRVVFFPLFDWATSLKILPLVAFPSLYFSIFVRFLFWIWIYWGIINLLPVYPLDGGHISQEICQAINARQGVRWSLQVSAAVGCIIAAVCLWFWIQSFTAAEGNVGFKDTLLNNNLLIGALFGYLAYQSFQILQSYTHHRSC